MCTQVLGRLHLHPELQCASLSVAAEPDPAVLERRWDSVPVVSFPHPTYYFGCNKRKQQRWERGKKNPQQPEIKPFGGISKAAPDDRCSVSALQCCLTDGREGPFAFTCALNILANDHQPRSETGLVVLDNVKSYQ